MFAYDEFVRYINIDSLYFDVNIFNEYFNELKNIYSKK